VLGEGRLATNRSAGGYLAVQVAATPGETLYAEVRHNDAAGGTGLYRISAGPVLDLDHPAPAGPLPDLEGTLAVAGRFSPGETVTYTLVLTNRGTGPQGDRPGHELIDLLPAEVTLLSATADSGTAVADPAQNSVAWDGSVAPGAAVTITIRAVLHPDTLGKTVSSQGTIAYDGDGLGLNWSTRHTDDPATAAAVDPTSFVVQAFAADVPTLSPAGLLLLVLLLGGFGLIALRRWR
jgi:uncharacterized repeat protein (TIGR01451 family)